MRFLDNIESAFFFLAHVWLTLLTAAVAGLILTFGLNPVLAFVSSCEYIASLLTVGVCVGVIVTFLSMHHVHRHKHRKPRHHYHLGHTPWGRGRLLSAQAGKVAA